MASAAFRSTTRRTAAEDAGSSNRAGIHRRTRSLSRYSGRFPPPPQDDPSDFTSPRGRFVNKERGSGFPEISLDDLADDFFRAREASEEESGSASAGRSGRRVSPRVETGSSSSVSSSRLMRGRSVSRLADRAALDVKGNAAGGASRRRRSVSVARYRPGDSENDMDASHSSGTRTKLRSLGNDNIQQPSIHKPKTSNHVLKRSMSQQELFRTYDSYSSHSSSLTDDEAREVHSNKNGPEKTIRAVYSLEKPEHPSEDGDGTGLYAAMKKEVRSAFEEIRTELEKAMVKSEPTSPANTDGSQPKSSNVVQVIADIRRNCNSKLEQSEKRKQDLLAELAVEEQRGQELTKIVRELLPVPKQTAPERTPRPRRRSNDRTRISKRLTEEAERYFEDFLSNVEDTDISSFDGERSDTSSTVGGGGKLRDSVVSHNVAETLANLRKVGSLPAETDGVKLPWLQWETSNDTCSPCKDKADVSLVSGNSLLAAVQEAISVSSKSNHYSTSSEGNDNPVSKGTMGSLLPVGSHKNSSYVGGAKGSSFDMDEYLLLHQNEELMFEKQRQRQRIESGSLILCTRNLFYL